MRLRVADSSAAALRLEGGEGEGGEISGGHGVPVVIAADRDWVVSVVPPKIGNDLAARQIGNMAEDAAKKKGKKAELTSTRDAELKVEIVRPKRPMKKGLACLDLVEDRQRVRLVGVMMIFSFYVLLQSALQSSSDPPPDPIVGDFAFSSTLPAEATTFQVLAHPVKLYVKSDNGSAMAFRPVFGRVSRVIQAEPPAYSLDCDSNRLHRYAGTLHEMQRRQACTPRIDLCSLENGSNPICDEVTNFTLVTGRLPVTGHRLPVGPGGAALPPALANESEYELVVNASNATRHENTVMVRANAVGVASFDGLVVKGAASSRLEFSFTAGDGSHKSSEMRVVPDVASLVVDRRDMPEQIRNKDYSNGPYVEVGKPFEDHERLSAPSVYVLDILGRPLRNRTVVAFGWQHPNFFASWVPENFAQKYLPSKSPGATRHHIRGQGYVMLDNAVSMPSDENGRAVFKGLTVRAATTKFLYLMFYCDGVIANWQDPNMRPLSTGLPEPPRYVSPLYIQSPVTQIQLVDKEGNPVDCSHLEKPDFTRSYPEGITQMNEETPPEEPFYVAVKGSNGAIAGVEVMAVVYQAGVTKYPFMEEPNGESFFDTVGTATADQKRLRNAISTPSDEAGIASFPYLMWTARGSADRGYPITTGGSVVVRYPEAHRIAFCTPGFTSNSSADGTSPDGCALSCPIAVKSKVVNIRWAAQPSFYFIRHESAPEDEFLPGELASKAEDLIAPLPAIQFVDADAVGVPDQSVSRVLLFDVAHCRRLCGSAGDDGYHSWDAATKSWTGVTGADADDEAWIAANWFTADHPLRTESPSPCSSWHGPVCIGCTACSSFVFERSHIDHASLVRRVTPADVGKSGPDGLTTLPTVFQQIDELYLNTLMARSALGRVRMLVMHGLEVVSRPSAPVRGFSYAAEALNSNRCARLEPYSTLTSDMVRTALNEKIVPDVNGGADNTWDCLNYVRNASAGDELPILSANCKPSSILYPFTGRPTHYPAEVDNYDVSTTVRDKAYWDNVFGSSYNGISWKSALMNPSSVAPRFQEVWSSATNKSVTALEEPIATLIALDTLGRPVPGLRVRLQNLQEALYPQLPASYHVVSCSLDPRCVTKLQTNAGSRTHGHEPLVWVDPDGYGTYTVEIAAGLTSAEEILAALANQSDSGSDSSTGAGTNSGLRITYANDRNVSKTIELPRSPVQFNYNAWYGHVTEQDCVGIAKPNGASFGVTGEEGHKVGMCAHELSVQPSNFSRCVESGPISAFINLVPSQQCGNNDPDSVQPARITNIRMDPDPAISKGILASNYENDYPFNIGNTEGSHGETFTCHLIIDLEMPHEAMNSGDEHCCRVNQAQITHDKPTPSEQSMLDVCETDENGIVRMRIAPGIDGGSFGEFVASGPTGSIPLRYEAFAIDGEGVASLACTSDSFSVGVDSTTERVEYDSWDESTGQSYFAAQQPDYATTALDLRHVQVDQSTQRLALANSTGPFEAGYDLKEAVPRTSEDYVTIGYSVKDKSLRPLPFLSIDAFDFVEYPPYLRGFEGASSSCETAPNCFNVYKYDHDVPSSGECPPPSLIQHVEGWLLNATCSAMLLSASDFGTDSDFGSGSDSGYGADSDVAGPDASCYYWGISSHCSYPPAASVFDYGKFQPAVNLPDMPYTFYPSRPHSTFEVIRAGASGYGQFSPTIHSGNPGTYGVVAVNNGVRSAPIIFDVVNKLEGGRIEIVVEPDPCLLTAAEFLELSVRNTSVTDARCGWAIGSILSSNTPEVRLLSRDGAPLPGYSAMVRAVDGPTIDARPMDNVRFDITTMEPEDPRRPFDSPLGVRRGTPADDNGISRYHGLVLLDAEERVCFYLQFYFASKVDMSDAVYNTSSTMICAGDRLGLSVTQQPSPTMTAEMPLETPPSIRSEVNMIELTEMDVAGAQYKLWMESFHGMLSIGDLSVQLYAIDKTPITDYRIRDALSDRFLTNSRCVVWRGISIVGGCGVTKCTKAGDNSNSDLAQLNALSTCDQRPAGADVLTHGKLAELIPQYGYIRDFLMTKGTTRFGDVFARNGTAFVNPNVESSSMRNLMCRKDSPVCPVANCAQGADDSCPVTLEHVGWLQDYYEFCDHDEILSDCFGEGSPEDFDPLRDIDGALIQFMFNSLNSWIYQNFETGGAWVERILNTVFFYSKPMTPDDVPVSYQQLRYDHFRLGGISKPNFALQFSASGAMSFSKPADAAITQETVLAADPAGIALLNQPPPSVTVGEVFLMKVKVTINSGGPLKGYRVLAEVSQPRGPHIGYQAFLDSQFNIEPASTSDEDVGLTPDRVEAVTDEFGIARFGVSFARGPRNSRPAIVSLSFATATGLRSTLSRPFEVVNDIQTVQVSQMSVNYAGNDCKLDDSDWIDARISANWPAVEFETACVAAIGSTARLLYENDDVLSMANDALFWTETFPKNLLLPPFRVSGLTADGSLVHRPFEVSFRIFTHKELESTYRASAEFQNLSAVAQSNAVDLITSTSGDDLLETFKSFAKVLVSGSQLDPTGPTQGSKQAEFELGDMLVNTDGTVDFVNCKLRVNTGGYGGSTFYLQAVAGGVAAAVHYSPDLKDPFERQNDAWTNLTLRAKKYNPNTAEAQATKMAIDVAIILLLSFVVVGNSDFHSLKFALPFSLVFLCAAFVVASMGLERVTSVRDRALWWFVSICCIALSYGWIVLGLVMKRLAPQSTIARWARPFADKRKENMFNYVRQLLKQPHNPDVLALAEGERLGTLNLKERMELEKRIQDKIQDERSFKTQFKAVLRETFVEDRSAFHFPTRIIAAFVCSIFSEALLCVGFLNGASSMRDSVRKMDVNTITTIQNMIVKLQDLYMKRTNYDLPTSAQEFFDDKVNQVHEYMVSLADAIYDGCIFGTVFAFLFYFASWLVLVIDFRVKVLQARRGIWTFNVKKIKLFGAFTYVGAQISNGLITYVIMFFLFALIASLFFWKATQDLIKYILETYWKQILVFAISPLANIVIKKVALIYIGNKQVIKNRYAFMAFDIYNIFMSCVTGIIKAIVRFVLAVVVLLFSLMRMDVSLFPAWVEYYLLLDTGSKSYQSVVVLHHHHNHPVLRVFCWLLEDLAEARARGDPGYLPGYAPDGTTPNPKLKLRIRLRKWLLMHHNPKVATYSADFNPAVGDHEIKEKPEKSGLVSKTVFRKNRKKEAPEPAVAVSHVTVEADASKKAPLDTPRVEQV